jgi:XTP/dITP diphosphohydrolase
MKLIFATQNLNKAKEIEQLLSEPFEVLTLAQMNCHDDIPETAETLEGNAEMKSRYIFEKFGVDCFADDTGLEIEALNGRPGVYSARYAGEQKNAEDNMTKVLQELAEESNRNARFRTVISLIWKGEQFQFEGIVNGVIATEKSGELGFGYDPIFIPESQNETFAEMNLTKKNTMSHRARAFEKMRDFLRNVVHH